MIYNFSGVGFIPVLNLKTLGFYNQIFVVAVSTLIFVGLHNLITGTTFKNE